MLDINPYHNSIPKPPLQSPPLAYKNHPYGKDNFPKRRPPRSRLDL